MADEVPQFNVDAIRAAKRTKRRSTIETSRVSSGGEGPAGTTSGSSNASLTPTLERGGVPGGDDSIQSDPAGLPDDVLRLLGQSPRHPHPPGLSVSSHPDPLLEEAAFFLKDFAGDAGAQVNSIWDRRFANERHIDTHLLTADDLANFEKVGLLALFRAQEATSLRNATIARFVEKEVRKMATQASTQLTEAKGKISKLEESHAAEMAKAVAREMELEARLRTALLKLDYLQARENALSEELKLKAQQEKTEQALLDDLPRQFAAGYERARSHFKHLFQDLELDFDQAGPWHKLAEGVLHPPSDGDDQSDVEREDHPDERTS